MLPNELKPMSSVIAGSCLFRAVMLLLFLHINLCDALDEICKDAYPYVCSDPVRAPVPDWPDIER